MAWMLDQTRKVEYIAGDEEAQKTPKDICGFSHPLCFCHTVASLSPRFKKSFASSLML